MKRLLYIATLLLLLVSCAREPMGVEVKRRVPTGTPVVLNLGFGVKDWYDIKIGTKAEVARTDEARVRDLYVLIFDGNGDKFYGRYFTYEHLNSNLKNLDENSNEGWYVENSANSRGVVKIATRSEEDCTLVLLANVANTIASLNHRDAVDVLSRISTLEDLESVRVTLEQEVVNRGDLFLMMAMTDGVDTGDLTWGEFDGEDAVYSLSGGNYQLRLRAIDAKVKFLIKYNETNIDREKCDARKWWVYNLPSECFLLPRNEQASDITFFDTQKAFFEGVDTVAGVPYETFSFYMLENRQQPRQLISSAPSPGYYLREAETNPEAVDPSYIYAPENATYVKFDMLLGLTTQGIQDATGDLSANHALTSEVVYTIHLGNFLDSRSSEGHDWDNYDVERASSYTYYVTINGSHSIYVEVLGPDHEAESGDETELESGQEGSLLLSTDDIVNCDAHYEYHCLTFRYTPGLQGRKVSWYVKTPFDEGGAQWIPDEETPDPNDGDWEFNCKDYLWVKFALNAVAEGVYSKSRVSFPGDTYVADWDHENDALASGQLLDIHQLYNFILDQTKLRKAWEDGGKVGDDPSVFIVESTGIADNPSTPRDETRDTVIRITAFVDEYYYEKDPTLDPSVATADPDLWRQFVNADPRELHILSEAVYSADKQSDVIQSSHSIIQRSIQTFYNTYSPDLRTLWGTEHVDEMEYRIRKEKDGDQTIWPWWPDARALPTSARPTDEENGRVNTAAIWGVAPKSTWSEATAPEWEGATGLLDYSVDNNTPELKDDYHYLAYSCLTRNRDNNGNGVIDPNEIRWYTAAVNQIVGMWVGNESLSPSARIYQPVNKNDITDGRNWRSWVVSSTAPSIANPRTVRAEEGCTKSDFNYYNWTNNPAFNTDMRNQVSSVRCVRNIGTYNEGGEVVDISYADYDVMVDQYYESPAGMDGSGKVQPNNDGTYTLRFSRLDPRSLREFTSVDLPYHEEYSMHNRVYLELNMQNPSNYVYSDGTGEGSLEALGKDEEDLNTDITTTGHNTYCPYGYRLPNMTEMLLMVALQPSTYWTDSKQYPCRTYFSRGKLGSKITTGEDEKIGWGYSSSTSRFHMLNDDATLSGIRCVRDNNCTGEITGNISVPGGEMLHLGDDCTIQLNITSMGSAISSLSLSLVYVNTSGVETTEPISIGDLRLSGVSIQDAVIPWTVPDDLTLLGNMSIRAVVRNNAGNQKILEAPIRILSPVFASVRLLPCEYDDTAENPSFPVLLTVSSPDATITSWRLSIKDPDKEVESIAIPADGRDTHYWSSTFNYDYDMADLIVGTYTFQIEALTSDGVHTRSNIASMDVLKVNYYPNPGTTGLGGDYEQATDITNLWEADKVENVNFYGGDFVEANMDITGCTYYPVYVNGSRNNNLTVGRDNLISIGVTGIDLPVSAMTLPYVYHIYYPAHDGGDSSGQDWVRPNISKSNGASNGTNYKAFTGGAGSGFIEQSTGKFKPDITKKQHFRLDRNGGFWNGQLMETSRWDADGQDGVPADAASSLERILSSETLYIGSTQGLHHSRARYCFVRAVHNSSESNAAGGGAHFDDDPVNGGNL